MEKSVFDSLYTRFVLRDFFGKIVPGAGLILWISKQVTSWESIVYFLEKLSTGSWILGLGVAWLVGVAAQSFAELVRLMIYWPPMKQKGLRRKERKARTITVNVRRMVEFDSKASDGMRHQVERLRVLKEACGTAAVVCALVFVVATGHFIWLILVERRDLVDALQKAGVEACIAGALFGFLQRMHREHVARQDHVMSEVMVSLPPTTPASTPSQTSPQDMGSS